MGHNDLRLFVNLNIQRFAATGSISCTVTSQDISTNTSIVRLVFTVTRTSGSTHWNDAKTVNFSCDGQSSTSSLALPSSKTSASCHKSFVISHNADGTKSISYSASISTGTSSGTITASGSMTLPTIPRYFSSSPSLWVVSKTETSITMGWSTPEACSQVQYNIGGGWVDAWYGSATSGTYTINGLSPNSSYSISGDFRRQDSQLWSTHGGYNVSVGESTYNYPYITSAPNFTIGNAYTIGLYNPLGRSCDVRILSSSNTQMASGTTTGGSINGFNDSTSVTNYYNSLPSSASSQYKVRLIVSSLNRDTTINGGTYSVNSANAPIFENFTYEDVNATTLALTNDNQTIIPKYSKARAIVSAANKATAQNGSTMASYKFICGDKYDTASYSESASVNMDIENVANGNFQVLAIDSRGLSTTVSKTATTVINYNELVKDVSSTLKRTGGVSEETTLTLKGTIWNDTFGDVTNSITSVTYKYRVMGSTSEYTTGATTITPTVAQDGNFTFTGIIQGDTNEGFDIANSYEVVVTVEDELSSLKYTFTLPNGKPHIAYHKNGISIMGAYNPENGGKLQIDGVNIEDLFSAGGSSLPIGAVIEFSGSSIPNGWLVCDGRSLAKTDYSDLFDVIGYTYGGSGANFNIPNLKGRVAVGYNSSESEFNSLGKTGGNKTHKHTTGGHTLTIDEMPSHTHGTTYGDWGRSDGSYGVISNLQGSGGAVGVGYTGGNQSHSHGDTGDTSSLQPYITIYYIIKAENIVQPPVQSSVKNDYSTSTIDVYSCNYVNGKQDELVSGTNIKTINGNSIVGSGNLTIASGEWGNITGTLSDQTDLQTALNSKANTNDIPTKVSDLTNDSGFIDNTVNNLTNYYTKTNTYNKTEIDNLIGQVAEFNIEVVQTLPVSDIDTHTIYLVPKTGSGTDVYDEYLYISNSWELIGNTAVDLSNYYTKSETDTLLGEKANSSDLATVATSGSYTDLSNKPNDKLVNVGTSVDTDYRTNILSSKNFYEKGTIQWFRNNTSVYDDRGNTNTSRIRSMPIQIKGGNTYTISGIPSGLTLNAAGPKCYDINKTYLGDRYVLYSGNTLTLPSNVAYISIMCNGTNLDDTTNTLMNNANIQVEIGTTATTYEPFIQKSINVDNNKFTDTINVGTYIDTSNRVNILSSKNLFSGNNYIDNCNINSSGKIETGTFQIYYERVFAGEIYTMSTGSSRQWVYSFFKDTPILNSTGNGRIVNTSVNETFVVPDGYNYIAIRRIDGGGEVISNLMLNAGSTATTYEPYITPSINVDGEEIYNSNIMNYSTNEQVIGKWIDGKPIYRKVIDCGILPNNTSKSISSGLTANTTRITNISGVARDNTSGYCTAIPHINTNGLGSGIQLEFNTSGAIFIRTQANYSSLNGYVILEYTKTTD